MQEEVLKTIASVFSLPIEQTSLFLDVMSSDTKEFPTPTYMRDVLKSFPPVKYSESESPQNNELNVNLDKRSLGQGEFGYVHPNQSRPYLYKYISQPIDTKTTDIWIRSVLQEPLINVILQSDPKVGNSICKIYKIFSEKNNRGEISLIFRLELLGPTLMLLDPFLLKSADPELNKRILFKTYAPLYKTLEYLRKTYSFEHGDLHSKNILFIKNPLRKDGTIKESRLQLKIIDFGYSGLVFEKKLYGMNEQVPSMIKSEVRHFFSDTLPQEFKEQIKTIETMYAGSGEKAVQRYLAIEKFIVEEAKKMNQATGGFLKRKTRKRRFHL